MNRRIALIAAAGLVVAGLVAASATATPTRQAREQSTRLLVGINDEASTLYGNPATAFAALKSLRTQVLRVNLYWGGNKWAVANKKPADATDPGDPAYRWAIYDRLVRYATDNKIKVVFSFLFTPGWANGNKARNVAPTNAKDLEHFAYAAAERYSGLWIPPAWQQNPSLGIGGSSPLPQVTMWTAWNEPNNPLWLTPQYKRVGKTWRVESAFQYAKICNALYNGVHAVLISPERGKVPGEQVACGVTGPKGNKRRIQMGNLNLLMAALTKLYGPKHLWITEYGYQTNPPDKTIMGTSWTKQALYMKQAYALARKNPRIDMMLWFLVRDQPQIGGWQSGLETVTGKKKPAWTAFRNLPRA